MSRKVYRIIKTITKKLCVFSSATIIAVFVSWWVYGFLLSTLVAFLGLSAIFYNAQDLLVFHPNIPLDSRSFVVQPSRYKMPFESIKLTMRDGVKIHLFFIKHPNIGINPHTVVFFHGNAGNIGMRLENAEGLYNELKVNILMVEYRGYGLSEGIPSESAFYADALFVFQYLLERNDIDHSKIILFGRSLGGAVAIDVASRLEAADRVRALIVENTFTSLPELAPLALNMPWLTRMPTFVHKNKFNSYEKIGKVQTPTLFVCGTADALVPPRMADALHARSGAAHKRLLSIPGGAHDTTHAHPLYYPALKTFLAQLPPHKPRDHRVSIQHV